MFFKQFPVIPYQFNIGGKNTLRMVKDITKGIKLSKELLDKLDYYSEYDITDGETIERISEKIYGNANYHWILMIANDKFDYTQDFPISNDALLEFVINKYGAGNENEQHVLFGRPHFKTQQGNTVYGYHILSVYVKNSIVRKGTVSTVGNLPTVGTDVGDLYIVANVGEGYVWNGSSWINAGPINKIEYPAKTQIEFIDSEWELPFSSSTGNVPTLTQDTNIISSNTAAAELIGVWGGNLNAPLKPGDVMPESGWIKIKTKNGNFSSGQTVILSNNGSIASIEVLSGGAGYTQGTPVIFSQSSNGSSASGTINVLNGVITSITITNRGSGYIQAPTISVPGGNGDISFLVKTDNATVVLSGNEKSTEPNSRIKAQGNLVIEDGLIKDVIITEPGSGYLNPPECRLSFISTFPVSLTLVYPDIIRISNYDYEFKLNEQKRKIKIINPKIIGQIADELKEIT